MTKSLIISKSKGKYEESTEDLITPTNDEIAAFRTAAYREQCDPLLAAYYAYTELKEKGKAAEVYAEWLAKRAEVQAMYPYNEE